MKYEILDSIGTSKKRTEFVMSDKGKFHTIKVVNGVSKILNTSNDYHIAFKFYEQKIGAN